MPQFTPDGCVVTPDLISALLVNKGAWAHAVLGQCFHMPDKIRKLLLSGEAEWQIPNKKTLIIILPESQ